MDIFENDELHQEQEYTAPSDMEETQPICEPVSQPEGQFYSGEGVGRRESPFADSPYVMRHSSQNTYQRTCSEQPVQEPEAKKAKVKKSCKKGMKRVLAAVLALAVLAGGCGITAAMVNNRWEERTAQMESSFNQQIQALQDQVAAASKNSGGTISGVATAGGMTPSQVYEQNVLSVVQVTCQIRSTTVWGQSATGTSVGSGFILTENGYIVTNYHVIEGATAVSITTYLGDEHAATVVGYDSTNDVAVLKVDAEGMPAVTIGSSSDLAVGDQVVVIGNALGELTGTMTVGYVSAKDRAVSTDNTIINMIQTDAAINSGNSGGPLFNMNGEVVGITTAKYTGESSSGATIEGIGFAIPIDDVLSMVEDLVNLGYITGAYLGVGVNDVDSAAQYYGIPAGAYVVEVNEGSCAQAAGVEVGDIIIALGEHEVNSYTALKTALRQFKAGDTTTITVYRSGQKLVMDITLDEKPQTEAADTETQQGMPDNGDYEEWYNYFYPNFGEGNG